MFSNVEGRLLVTSPASFAIERGNDYWKRQTRTDSQPTSIQI